MSGKLLQLFLALFPPQEIEGCFTMGSVRASVINNGYNDTVLCKSWDNDLQQWH